MLGKMRIVKFVVILAFIFHDCMAAQYEHFYPFGGSEGDNELNSYRAQIDLSKPLLVFGDKYTKLFVYSFGQVILDSSKRVIIAPFGAAMNEGQVWYRLSSTRQLRKRGNQDLRNKFASCGGTSKVRFGLVVTYEEVDFWGNHDPECYAVRGRAYCHCMGNTEFQDEAICNCTERLGNPYLCRCLEQTNFNYELCECIHGGVHDYHKCECLVANDFDDAYCDCVIAFEGEHPYCRCEAAHGFSYCMCIWFSSNDPSYCNCTYLGDCSNLTRRDVDTQEFIRNIIGVEMPPAKSRFSERNQQHRQLTRRIQKIEEDSHSHETRAVQYLPRNTLQLVVLSSRRKTFVIFNYGKISWTTSDYQDGVLGHGGNFTDVYIDAGDGVRRYTHPLSGSEGLHNLTSASNVGEPGVWMYRVDGNQILGPDCNPV